MGQIIKLSKDEVRVCVTLAVERWLIKWGSTDRLNYADGKGKGWLEHDLLAGIRANVSEYAVAKFTNQTWSVPWYPNDLHFDRKHLPDVGINGEVRTIRTQTGIPFWDKDEGKTIYGARVVDDVNFSEVELFEPFQANDYMVDEYADPTINGWRVAVSMLS